MKITLKILLFLVTFSALAQQQNVLADRAFWLQNPSLETLKQKISEGHDPTALNENGFDATVYALITKTDNKIINYLLSLEGNPIDKRTHDSRIYLHWAAYAGEIQNVISLLEKGSSITARDSRGNTPLTFAATSGLTIREIYNLFIAKGVDLTQEKDQNGANTLLLAAPYLKNEADINFYIDKGISLNSIDDEGNGIFNYATRRGNIEFLKLLVNKGVDYKTLNKNGGNAFLFAAQGTRGFENKFEVYQYLKNLGLKPNIVTIDGLAPLHRLAYSTSDKNIFELFLSAGADVNQKDSEGNTPFLNAASRNKLEIVKLLSNNLNDYNYANNEGQTALMLAVAGNNPQVVDFLLQKGSDAIAKDSNGNTVAYYLAKSYLANNSDAFESKLEILKSIGLKLNTTQANGNTLYHFAASENNLELMKRLATFQIPVNAKNNEGITALHQAAMKAENDEMMKYLISIGANKNVKTSFDETAFDLASENEQLQKQNIPLNFLK